MSLIFAEDFACEGVFGRILCVVLIYLRGARERELAWRLIGERRMGGGGEEAERPSWWSILLYSVQVTEGGGMRAVLKFGCIEDLGIFMTFILLVTAKKKSSRIAGIRLRFLKPP